MNSATLALNLSNVTGDFLHRLFEKRPYFNAIIIELSATSELKFWIRTETD